MQPHDNDCKEIIIQFAPSQIEIYCVLCPEGFYFYFLYPDRFFYSHANNSTSKQGIVVYNEHLIVISYGKLPLLTSAYTKKLINAFLVYLISMSGAA